MAKVYLMDEELYRAVKDTVAWVRNFRGPNVRNDPRGATFSLPSSGGRTPPQMGGGSTVTQFRFKEEFENYIRCRTWDGTTEGTIDYYIAKPVRYRGSATSGYYTSNATVYAAKSSNKTGLLDASNRDIFWVDISDRLPTGSGQYKVLQLNASANAVWDYTRAH
jgi:hypothetical protein